MTCDEVRDELLEADLDVLGSAADSPLAEHVRWCASCRAVASQLIAATATTRSAYGAIRPVREPRPLPARTIVRPALLAMASLAAAAAIVLSVLSQGDRSDPLHGGHWVELQESSSASLAVDIPAGRNAVVFRTTNPLVDVVWIY